MKTSAISNEKRFILFISYLLCLFALLLTSSCGGERRDSESPKTSGTASAVFTIQWHNNIHAISYSESTVSAKALNCENAGVTTITCSVYDESNTYLTMGEWPCHEHTGRIEGIPAGQNRTFVILGADADGNIMHHGRTMGVTITPGAINDVGTIDAFPFIPSLSTPEDRMNVTANAFSLNWNSVTNAHAYRVLISENSSVFESPIIDDITTETTYTPLNLSPSTTYYWKVHAVDIHENYGIASEIWRFTTTAAVVCRSPVLDPIGDRQVDEGQLLEITINAADPDSDDQLTYSSSTLPTGASFDPASRRFSWATNFGDAGNYNVRFIVCDSCPEGPLCDSEEVIIAVGDVNRPPVLDKIGNRQVDEGQLLAFTINATDPDSDDQLTYSTGELPTGANFETATRTFSWTPGYDDTGNYAVLFRVCDDRPVSQGGPLCDTEEVVISVGDVNRPPVLEGIGNRQVDEGRLLEITLHATDPDTGDQLTYSTGELPGGASFVDRTFSWTPGYEDAGNYTVLFKVCDDSPASNGGPLCDSEEVTITVGDSCRPPALDPIGNWQVFTDQRLTFTIHATDPDTGDKLTYRAEGLPEGASLDGRTFNWTPNSKDIGLHRIVFTVCDDCPASDGGPLCDSESVTVTVCEINISPASADFPPSGGNGIIYVDVSGSDCNWSASENVDWIEITSISVGIDAPEVIYSVSANTGTSSRSATITVGGKSHVVTQSSASLEAPVQVSPESGTVFDYFPRTTTVTWMGVNGASSYSVEVDCYHCCQVNQWCTDIGETWRIYTHIQETQHVFDFVGAQPGRWRVWAVDEKGYDGPSSPWWYFEYLR